MNSLFQINRRQREIADPEQSYKQQMLDKIMVSYGYDRDTAEKIMAYQEVESVKAMFGLMVGGVVAYKFQPI
jgi:hypothetical protein